MKTFRLPLVLLAVTMGLLSQASPVQAQATRTWVSGVGDDANPCSRTAPCKTFAGAISKTATGGEINCLDPGGFGAVTIVKAITIDCEGTFGSVLAPGTNGIIVNAPAGSVVILRNLSINGAGSGVDGIRFLQGGALHVENMRLLSLTGQGIDAPLTAAGDLFVSDTIISGAAGGGILVSPVAGVNASVALERVQLLRNGSFGLRVTDRGKATVSNSVAASNSGNGFHALSTTQAALMMIYNSIASRNAKSGIASEGASSSARIGSNFITLNSVGISGNVLSFSNNLLTGNGTEGIPTGTISLR